ncbi:MAG: RNA polymerase sigma factor [Phycisphaerae bacterium]
MADGVHDGDLAKAQDGDADALTRLLARYGPEVCAGLQIQPPWRSVVDPDDIMQVTYTEAFLRIGSFTADSPDAFCNWLRVLARNNLRDAIRGLEAQKRPHPRRRVVDNGEVYDCLAEILGVTTSTPSRAAARCDIQAAVEAALTMIPADYAAAVRMIDLEGLSAREAAARLGQSEAAVVMRAVRGRDRLRDVIGSPSRFFSS